MHGQCPYKRIYAFRQPSFFEELFALRRLMRFSQAYPSAAAIFVDEFDAGHLQGAPNRQVVGSRHRRLTASKFGAANSCDANRRLASKISSAPLN